MAKASKEEQRKTPILRFKGFTDDWEQRKLGEIGKIRSCKRIYRDQTSNKGEIPFYKIGTFGKKADSFISQKLYEEYKEKFSFPQIGDILISASGTLGRTVVYNGEDAYFQDSNIVWLDNDNHLVLNKYLEVYYQRVHWKTSEGSTIKRLYNSDIEGTIISIPKRDEQAKISECLRLLNKVITLYENKRKLLTSLFQGLSQYLFNFSKEKNAIQMSLSSVTLSETKGIAKENALSSGNIEYLDTTRLNGGEAKLVSGKKDVDFQDIIVLWDGSNAGKIYYGFSGILGSTLKVFKLKDNINSEYVYYYLKFRQNLILHKFRTPNIPHVSKDFSQRFNLPIPDNEEQNLIANILHLNELQINLISKKVKKLKQVKEYLLQNMFL